MNEGNIRSHPAAVIMLFSLEFWKTTRAKLPHGRPRNVLPFAAAAAPFPSIILLYSEN